MVALSATSIKDLHLDDIKDENIRQAFLLLQRSMQFFIRQASTSVSENAPAAIDYTDVGFQNAWANYGAGYQTCQYGKDQFGVVHLRGLATAGVVGPGVHMFTLPTGFIPAAAEIFIVASNGATGILQIDTLGNADLAIGSNVYCSLSGITFSAPS
jgi:hypothetical protein